MKASFLSTAQSEQDALGLNSPSSLRAHLITHDNLSALAHETLRVNLESDDLIALLNQLLEAWMALIIPIQLHTARYYLILYTKRAGAEIASTRDPIFHRLKQTVELMIRLGQFRNPPCTCTIKNELDIIMGVFEFFDCFESIHRSSQAFVSLGISQDNNCNF